MDVYRAKTAGFCMRQRVEIHFHHGTRECAARVVFRDRDKLAPGETALAELRFKEPMQAAIKMGLSL